MSVRGQAQRRDDEPAYVLHTYAYRETSLIVEALTAEHGRVALVARGAKRPRSDLRGLLQGFQPLLLSWSGAAEMKTLQKAEWRGGLPRLSGPALLCGFYVNELLLKLLPREDPHRPLYDAYETALQDLAAGGDQAPVLRRFELALLADLGYALPLAQEAGTGAAIDPAARYHYAFDRGPVRLDARVVGEPQRGATIVAGATLIALAQRRFDEPGTAAEAKRLMREVLDHHLEQRGVESRRLLQDLQALAGERPQGRPASGLPPEGADGETWGGPAFPRERSESHD
jgi:DNA repair protein RecO (recombination protein O)